MSPITGANLKPWPEHALRMTTRGDSGCRSTMKCWSGVFVYRHTALRTTCRDTPRRCLRDEQAQRVEVGVGHDAAHDVGIDGARRRDGGPA